MARDDYFVIVYQVLKYLYDCLKKGEKPERSFLTASQYSLPEPYWVYIIEALLRDDYIVGIDPENTKDGIYWGDLTKALITPKGIEYLFENSMLQKVKKTLKNVKDIIPGF